MLVLCFGDSSSISDSIDLCMTQGNLKRESVVVLSCMEVSCVPLDLLVIKPPCNFVSVCCFSCVDLINRSCRLSCSKDEAMMCADWAK